MDDEMLPHGEVDPELGADWNCAKAEFNPKPADDPTACWFACPAAKFGVDLPRFHNPDDGLGLRWFPVAFDVGLGGPPLPLDHGDEKADDPGDLFALITPGSKKLDGEDGPERGADVVKLGLRWCDPVMGRRC